MNGERLHQILRIARPLPISHSSSQNNRNERGFTYAFIALLLPMILGFAGLVIEVGEVLEVRRQLQTAVDAAALAGAQDLPQAPATAQTNAADYVNRNRESQAATTITISTTYVADDTITVTANQNVPLVLMPLVGYANQQNVGATATAIVGSIGEECVLPLAVITNTNSISGAPWYPIGASVVITYDNSSLPGTIEPLWIYGKGDNDVRDGINGSRCVRAGVGDTMEYPAGPGLALGGIKGGFTDVYGPGVTTCPDLFDDVFQSNGNGTYTVLKYSDCTRIVPLVYDQNIKPGYQTVTILGFSLFFIESWDLQGGGRPYTISGRFADPLVPATWGQYNGLEKVVRLLR